MCGWEVWGQTFIFRGLPKWPLSALKIDSLHQALKICINTDEHSFSHGKHQQAAPSETSSHSCQGTYCPNVFHTPQFGCFIYQPPPSVLENFASSPQPNHIPTSDLSKFSPPSSTARPAHLAPITPARRLPRPSPFQHA